MVCMKKWISMALSLVLLFGLMVPAAAAESQETRLQEITLKVKEQLGIDTEIYTEFYGELSEGMLRNTWNLSWYSPEGFSLEVTASEEGMITSFYRYDVTVSDPYRYFYGPKLPQKNDGAASAAQAFLTQVLETGESVGELSPYSYRSSANTQFYGTILVNGLPSPFTYRISVRNADQMVTSFSRTTKNSYTDKVPSATPAAAVEDAATQLATTNTFRLEYVMNDEGTMAVLRYLPESKDSYYVDAQSGKLINLTALANALRAGETANADDFAVMTSEEAPMAGAAADRDAYLTETELKGAEQLKDVLPAETLVSILRETYPQLKLDDFSLASISYSVEDKTEGTIGAYLTMAKADGTDTTRYFRYYVDMDGKTGELRSFYSYRSRESYVTKVSFAEGQTIAESFVAAFDPKTTDMTLELTGSYDAAESKYSSAHSYTFTQKVNGYLFRDNHFRVEVDIETGAVRSLFYSFDHDVVFDTPDGLISESEANRAYYTAFTTRLGYIGVPFSLDPNEPEYKPMIEVGQSYLYELTLAYTEEITDQAVSGVDAKTGKPVYYSYNSETPKLTYTDLNGHWAKNQIEALAEEYIGFDGDAFQPGKTLTQVDLVALLMSANGGGVYDLTDTEAVDALYRYAYSSGLLNYGERNENKIITRAEMVKFVLDISGYGRVARLEGIFTCSFSDAGQIPAEYLGYAAVAQGLGLVQGGASGEFAPNRTATRAEAAVILYNLMSRI